MRKAKASGSEAEEDDNLDSTPKAPPVVVAHQKRISHERAAALAARLSKFDPRPEYMQTPGPYTIRYNPSSRKVPFVFRTMERFPPPPPAPSESLDCNRAQCEPRSRNVVLPKEERFYVPPSATRDVAVYDVESGVRACEERSRSTLLPPHGTPSRPTSPARSTTPPAADPTTLVPTGFNSALISGGRISKSGVRDVNDFLVKRSASPGPVYSPTYTSVEPASFGARFSTQSRMQSTTKPPRPQSADASRCRCLREYPDNDSGVRNYRILSTWENAPIAAMGKPSAPFVNPNKQQAPPPPEDDAMPPKTFASRRPIAPLRGSVAIQDSCGEDVDAEECKHQTAHVLPSTSDDCTRGIVPQRATSGRAELSCATVVPPASLHDMGPNMLSRALESPFHASRMESPAPVHLCTLEWSATTDSLDDTAPPPTAVHDSGLRRRWDRRIGEASLSSVSRHPWMAPNDYMQLDVTERITSNVVEMCANPRRTKFGGEHSAAKGAAGTARSASAKGKRRVAGGWGWASTWQRGIKASS